MAVVVCFVARTALGLRKKGTARDWGTGEPSHPGSYLVRKALVTRRGLGVVVGVICLVIDMIMIDGVKSSFRFGIGYEDEMSGLNALII
jgi:hypothetical protein